MTRRAEPVIETAVITPSGVPALGPIRDASSRMNRQVWHNGAPMASHPAHRVVKTASSSLATEERLTTGLLSDAGAMIEDMPRS
jgi:hypothetical protein